MDLSAPHPPPNPPPSFYRSVMCWLSSSSCCDLSDLPGTNAGEVEKLVPADALLLAGTCIVDEAVLTGESTPQWKAAVGTPEELTAQGEGLEHRLSIKRDKNHVLFSGTKLIQHTGDKEAHIKTPDGACLAVVLRTGFETSQGTQLASPSLASRHIPCIFLPAAWHLIAVDATAFG